MTTARGLRALGLCVLGLATAAAAAHATALVVVSQKGRAFQPKAVEIERGGIVRIVNDDEFVHHVYVKADEFSFESGEQDPGTSTEIVFSEPGEFEVRCGLHPKMRLHVIVR
jgi:plastocyanin